MMAGVTRELAAFVAKAPAGAASPRAAEIVRQALLDLTGVVIAGAEEEAGRLALRYARSQAAPGPAAVLGGGTRLSPALAALVNGTAGHALDYDDIGLGAGHISVAIVPALHSIPQQTRASRAPFPVPLAIT